MALLVAGALAGGWGLFEYGRLRGGYDHMAAARERQALLDTIAGLEARNRELSGRIAILERASEVDRHAYAEVDQTLKSLQDELLELREEVAFYRGIVGPADISKGLHIQSFMVRRGAGANTYHYRLIMTQYGKNTRAVRGVTKLSVVGVQDGRQLELDLKALDPRRRPYMKFRFKYFQELTGDLKLPDGFLPLRVKLRTVPQGKGIGAAEKVYNWAEVIS